MVSSVEERVKVDHPFSKEKNFDVKELEMFNKL